MSTTLRFPAGLYGVTPDWEDGDKLCAAVRAAARGGMTSLQLRHKGQQPSKRRELALRLQDVCRQAGVVFLINDDWRLAYAIGADGVHLGREDDAPALVRKEVGPDMLIGVSCYADLARAQEFLTEGVAYIAFGAMFASQTKPLAPPATLEVVRAGRALCEQFPAPRPSVVAIGGITMQNAGQIVAAGVDSLAVVGGLFLADDIEATARKLCASFS
jgi:thiamine-phosphate pyrophosphorylase